MPFASAKIKKPSHEFPKAAKPQLNKSHRKDAKHAEIKNAFLCVLCVSGVKKTFQNAKDLLVSSTN